ncbi:MAG: PQQ-dependent sugar dehydrogenase [Gemmatimonadota bacterium]
MHRGAPTFILAGFPVLLGALGCAGAESAASSEAVQAAAVDETHSYRVTTVVDGLENPWSMAFLPNGDMLVTERPGRLRLVREGALLPDPIAGVPEVRVYGQGGLLDVALHPEFETNRLVYLSFAKPNAGASEATTAVVRGRLEGNALVDVDEILEADAWGPGRDHFGSRLLFDDDGYLFITIGDRGLQADPADLAGHPAQDLGTLRGKILRLHDDGRIPADNPFIDTPGARPEIWSYGHRSPQGLAFHPVTRELWETEHGPQGGDELNRILPGRNYGWPVIGYGVEYGGDRIHSSSASEGMEQPVHYWVPSIATSGLMIYDGDRFPAWRGNAFVGGLAGQQLARVSLDGASSTGEETLLEDMGRVRDIRQGPDGYIYVALEARGGATTPIVRLEPEDGGM